MSDNVEVPSEDHENLKAHGDDDDVLVLVGGRSTCTMTGLAAG